MIHSFRHFRTNNVGVERAIDVSTGHVGQATTGALCFQFFDRDPSTLMKKFPFDGGFEGSTTTKGAI